MNKHDVHDPLGAAHCGDSLTGSMFTQIDFSREGWKRAEDLIVPIANNHSARAPIYSSGSSTRSLRP